eukprot:1063862-Pelagomonas_calceolata.AAC.1
MDTFLDLMWERPEGLVHYAIRTCLFPGTVVRCFSWQRRGCPDNEAQIGLEWIWMRRRRRKWEEWRRGTWVGVRLRGGSMQRFLAEGANV